MRYRYLILITVCFCLVLKASAQQATVIKGVISKKLSTERVPNVAVTNLKTKEFAMSDDGGWFTIKATIGDTLLFTKADYTDQKVGIINTGDLPVYLQPVIKLAEVKIQGQSTRQELNDVMKDYGKKGIYYNGNPPLASILLNPLNDLHLLFGRDAANLRHFKEFSKGEIEYAEVRRRYNIPVVMRVTNVSDTNVVKKFMEYYTPSYEDIKQWNDYELVKHIKDSYDFYDKSEDKEALRRLNTPVLLGEPDKRKTPTPPTP
jgi:hypothetical protein